MRFTESHRLFERAKRVIPGGVNSPVRAFKSVDLDPPFIARGDGARVWDADGNEFIDYVGSWGPLILGHNHPAVRAAVVEALGRGASFGAPTAAEVALAEEVAAAVPSVEMVRLVNSGTEATMGAVRCARGATGRDKVVKFVGCFHGSVDYLLVQAGSGATTLGRPDSAGVPQAFVDETLLAPFNDLEAVAALVDDHQGQIACVILEPVAGNMGMIAPEAGFLAGLRDLCDRDGIVLIFDEVMTGFRVDYGGAQALLGVEPDLTTLGKVIGGGLPVGAYGGRQDLMLNVSPVGAVYQAGTLSGNPIATAAGLATLALLKDGRAYADLGRATNWLAGQLRDACAAKGLPIQTTQMGGMFGFFFSPEPVRDYADALKTDVALFKRFFKGMLTRGIYLPPSAFESCFLSTAHTEGDLERTAEAFRATLADL